jgi:hypothetical protein
MVHRATNTDDCTTIASQYNITESLLLDNNPSLSCDQVYDGLMLCVVQGIVRPPSPTALNVSYVATDNSSNVQAVMPLGTAIIATNAVEAGPHNTTSSTSASATSTSKTEADTKEEHDSVKRRGRHLDSRNGHAHNHHAAAKRHHDSQY